MPWPDFRDIFPFLVPSDLKMPEPETVLWRYMDLTKLLAILGNERLHFTRIDQFNDRFEGVTPRKALEALARKVRSAHLEEALKIRQRTHALCWHASETESEAMWRLYLSSNEGIAIKTTAQRLRESLRLTKGVDQPLLLVEVEYVNHLDDDEMLAPVDFLRWATFKRKSFAHEREVRLMRIAQDDELGNNFSYRPKIDVQTLIEAIYISPFAPDWVFEVIKQVVSKYGNYQVKPSELGGDPTYISHFIQELQESGRAPEAMQ